MVERPILFSGPLVRAILAERKTQTRRLATIPDDVAAVIDREGPGWSWSFGADGWGGAHRPYNRGTFSVPLPRCPYGGPGARLWVRETWRPVECEADGVDGVLYQADGAFQSIQPTREAADQWLEVFDRREVPGRAPAAGYVPRRGRWRPTIHMPRWASRISLEVTAVRVHRLHDISEDDARAEGISTSVVDPSPTGLGALKMKHYANARDAFADLWDLINGARASWASNPWVWVVTFRRVEGAARG